MRPFGHKCILQLAGSVIPLASISFLDAIDANTCTSTPVCATLFVILLVCSRRTCLHSYIVAPQPCDVGHVGQEFLPQRKTAIEGPVTESAILELLKAGKEAELDLYTN